MPDSTAFIDTTSDSTTIIIIDSTTSDVQNFQATVATGLVSDFNGFMGPLGAKCDALGGQFDSIKDQISGIGNNYTPGGAFNNGVANGLNEAYNSSKWAQGKDALDMAKNVLDKCDFFKEMAPTFPKYGDPFKQIKSLASSAADKAISSADAAIDKIKASSGYQFLEAGIGKSLAAITNTGRTVYDKVEGAVENIEEAISPVIEYGKGAVSQTKTALSSATKELAKMDKLINCLSTVGGPDFSPQLDEMMDQMNCYYDKLGVFDDPVLPNFGEFNVDQYLSTIGNLDPQAAENIKKSINMYSKAKNNAEGSVAKATDIAKKAKSATDPSATAKPIAQKKEAVAANVQTVQVIPAIPGKTEEKTITVPEPEPIPEPELPDPPVPPEPKVPITMWINKVQVDNSIENYDDFDPGHAQYSKFLSAAASAYSTAEVVEPDDTPNLEVRVIVQSYRVYVKEEKDWKRTKSYLAGIRATVGVAIGNRTTDLFYTRSESGLGKSGTWTKDRDLIDTVEYQKPLLMAAIIDGLNDCLVQSSNIAGIF